jgi:hypothetical protein
MTAFPAAFLKNRIRLFNATQLCSVDAEMLDELFTGYVLKVVVMLPADNIKSMKCASPLITNVLGKLESF